MPVTVVLGGRVADFGHTENRGGAMVNRYCDIRQVS
jgi:hypothetical protein